jgi:cell division inhibitor SepF
MMKKAMAYLGLVDDDDDYGYAEYDSRPARTRSSVLDDRDSGPPTASVPRTVRPAAEFDSQSSAPVAPAQRLSGGISSVRPVIPEATAKVHIVAPERFADAQEIANRLMADQPVIVNMQSASRDLQRRMIDFCSGVTYALSGGMERVADEVFLLTPSNVKVSDEERQRLADRGLVST